jgi:3-deoxy-manno-octulosonate cytidylyltransferase (CMP-KDO synthetase)
MKTKAQLVIPARLGSTRLPGKVLADLGGKPVLRHVWEAASRARLTEAPWILTDAPEVRDVVKAWGGRVIMTSPECRSGTERLVSVLDQLEGGFFVNVQGDEPFIDPAVIDALVERHEATGAPLVTAVYPLRSAESLGNPNVVKAVRAHDGRVLYFSRAAVPHCRDLPDHGAWLGQGAYWGHFGVYGYARSVLEGHPALPPSPLEEIERLEQLRFLEAGFTFQTIEVAAPTVAIDTPEDLLKARQMLAARRT